MNIPLDSFELEIDETILKRGMSYFKKGAAVLFYHQMDVMGLEAPKKKKPQKASAPRKTANDKFKERINNADPEMIRKFVTRLGLHDASFRRQAMGFFMDQGEGSAF